MPILQPGLLCAKIVLLIGILTFCCRSSRGMWQTIPLEELVQDSDLIIIGTLSQIQRECDGITDFCTGTLTVKDCLWGDSSPGRKLLLTWEDALGWSSQIEHRQHESQEKLWLLKCDTGRIVRADYPWRVRDSSERAIVERLIQSYPVCAKGWPFLSADGHRCADLPFRNVTTSPLTIPVIASTSPSLLGLGHQAHIQFIRNRWNGEVIPVGDLLFTTATTVIQPGKEFRHTIRLDDFTTNPEVMTLSWEIDGYGKSSPPYIGNCEHRTPNTGYEPYQELPLWRRLMNRATVGDR